MAGSHHALNFLTMPRRLFVRVAHGCYQFNPALAVRRRSSFGESWVLILDALNLRFVAECAQPYLWPRIDALFAMAGQPPIETPVGRARSANAMAAGRAQVDAPVFRKIGAISRDSEIPESLAVERDPPPEFPVSPPPATAT
jgi:hypothetical protein